MDINDRYDDEQLAALLKVAGPRPAVDAEVVRRVRVVAHDAWHAELRQRARRRTIGWLSAAAAAVIIVILTIPRSQSPTPVPAVRVATVERIEGRTSVRVGDAIKTGAVVSTAPESFATLQWGDRGSLRIAAGSRIRFDATDSIRLEHGAIYFASSTPGKPIRVQTRFGTVRDIGTAFEVRVDRKALQVRVREGLVELQHEHSIERAGAGFQLLLQEGSGVTRSAISTRGADWHWVLLAAPPIVLDGNAHGVLAAIAREEGLTLVFADQTIAARVNRTSLHDHVPLAPDEALDAATLAADLSYRINGSTLIIDGNRKR